MPDPQPDLQVTSSRENYFKRVQATIDRYYWIGRTMRRRYLLSRLVAAIGSVVIPVLSNLPLTYTVNGLNVDFAKYGVTFVGLLVALAISIEGVLRYRERTVEYSKTSQSLQAELQLYLARAKDYSKKDETEAFGTLVERIEDSLMKMRESTLGALTRPDVPSSSEGKH
jgi:Protein of unknown function (DUF4231)